MIYVILTRDKLLQTDWIPFRAYSKLAHAIEYINSYACHPMCNCEYMIRETEYVGDKDKANVFILMVRLNRSFTPFATKFYPIEAYTTFELATRATRAMGDIEGYSYEVRAAKYNECT